MITSSNTCIRPLVAALFLLAIATTILAQTTTDTTLPPLDTAPPVAPVPQLADEVGAAAPAQKGDDTKEAPSKGQQTDVQHGAGDPRDTQERRPKAEYYWSIAGSVATVLSSLVLAAVGIFGLLFVKKQLAAMEESNRNAQKNAERTLAAMEESNRTTRDAFVIAHRARLGIVRIDSLPFEPNTAVNIFVTVENTGGSVARKIRTASGFALLEGDIPEVPSLRDKIPKGTALAVLHPGLESVDASTGPILSGEQIGRLEAGDLRLYAFGVILYEDEFGQSRHTEYCVLYTVRKYKTGWVATPVGNWAD